jgi:hypothetical protein
MTDSAMPLTSMTAGKVGKGLEVRATMPGTVRITWGAMFVADAATAGRAGDDLIAGQDRLGFVGAATSVMFTNEPTAVVGPPQML